nr:spastin-like [Dermacentor andersoni]
MEVFPTALTHGSQVSQMCLQVEGEEIMPEEFHRTPGWLHNGGHTSRTRLHATQDLKELAIGLYRNGSEQLQKGIAIDFSQGQGPTWEWANTLKEKMRANLEIALDRLDFLETMVMIQHLGEDLPWHAGVARRQAKPKRRRWEKKDRKDADNRGDGPSWLKRAINGVGMTNQLAHIILEEIVDGCPEVLFSDIAGQKEGKQLHTGSEERILVMGATSSSQELDDAALRHYKERVYATRLDANMRMVLLEKLLSKHNSPLSLGEFKYLGRSSMC